VNGIGEIEAISAQLSGIIERLWPKVILLIM
jgi:hypothetical protein